MFQESNLIVAQFGIERDLEYFENVQYKLEYVQM